MPSTRRSYGSRSETTLAGFFAALSGVGIREQPRPLSLEPEMGVCENKGTLIQTPN